MLEFLCYGSKKALIAQLDRASDFGSEGRGFESFWERQKEYKEDSDVLFSLLN